MRCQQRVELGENERRVLRKGEQEEIQLLYFRLLSFIFVSVLLVHIPDAVTLLHRISILWYAMLTGRNSTFRKATMLKSARTFQEDGKTGSVVSLNVNRHNVLEMCKAQCSEVVAPNCGGLGRTEGCASSPLAHSKSVD